MSKLKTTYLLNEGAESYGRRRGEKNSMLMEDQLSRISPIHIGDDAVSVLRRFQKDPRASILPVVNSRNEPQGVIREEDLKQYVYSPYGISLFKNHSHSRGLDSFIDRVPITEISSSLSSILDISALFNGEKGILVTKNGKYMGLLAPSDLLKLIYEHKLNYAREQNPLSGLPGNFSIHRKLSEIRKSGKASARVIFFDFNSFKPFNDNYGFRMGDRLIILFAEILKKSFRLNHDFIGHVGGDDFIVIQEDPHRDEECGVVRGVQSDFSSGALPYYSREDRDRGCINARNRRGRMECFPMITVAAAVLDIPRPENVEMENLNNQLFALKKRAKESKDFFARTNYRESDLAVTSSMEFSSLRKEERASSSAVV